MVILKLDIRLLSCTNVTIKMTKIKLC